MHIAMFSDCYTPVINGVVTSISCLKAALEAEGHTVTVYAPAVPPEREARRFFSLIWPFNPEQRASFPWPPGTMWTMAREKVDIVHIHTPFNVGLLGWLKAKFGRHPMVFTHHTLWEEYIHYLPVRPSTGRWLARGVCGFFFRRSARLVAPSEEVRAKMRAQGVSKPIEVIPTGIDTRLFEGGDAQRARQELGLAPEDRLFLYIGRVGKEKSIDFLVRSFQAVERSNYHFRLIGDGPERKALERLVEELGLSQRVRFLGYRPRVELRHYLAASRGFLFASQTETQGLVSLEASAAGVPVVGVRASGTNEAVRDGYSGFLLEPGDLAGFSAAIARLGEDDLLQAELGGQAREWAQGFSAQAMGRGMTACYQAALAARKGKK